MASKVSKTLELILSFQNADVVKRLREVGLAFDKSIGKFSRETPQQVQRLNQAFQTLNIRPFREIETEIKKIQRAYHTLAASGRMSKMELQKAAQVTKTRVAELRQTMQLTSQSAVGLNQAMLGASAAFYAFQRIMRTLSGQFIEFDNAMKSVKAISGATGDTLERMTQLAKDMGATTRYTATQAAEGLKYLSMAGFDAEKSISALPGTLQLAAAGNLDLGTAADITTNILMGYNKTTEELSEVNDALVQTFTNSNTVLTELGDAFKMVAPIASNLGVDFNEAAAALGMLANNGIKGSQAGMVLRNVIARLLTPTGDAQEVIQLLSDRIGGAGFQIKDSQGTFVGFTRIIEQLEQAGIEGDEALRLFGLRAGPGMVALVGAGSEALGELRDKIDASAGRAQAVAEGMMEGIGGALKLFKSAWEGAFIAIGERLAPFLKFVVEGFTSLAKVILSLPAPLQTFIGFIGVLIATMTAWKAGLGILAVAIFNTTKALFAKQIAVNGLTISMRALTVAIMGAYGVFLLTYNITRELMEVFKLDDSVINSWKWFSTVIDNIRIGILNLRKEWRLFWNENADTSDLDVRITAIQNERLAINDLEEFKRRERERTADFDNELEARRKDYLLQSAKERLEEESRLDQKKRDEIEATYQLELALIKQLTNTSLTESQLIQEQNKREIEAAVKKHTALISMENAKIRQLEQLRDRELDLIKTRSEKELKVLHDKMMEGLISLEQFEKQTEEIKQTSAERIEKIEKESVIKLSEVWGAKAQAQKNAMEQVGDSYDLIAEKTKELVFKTHEQIQSELALYDTRKEQIKNNYDDILNYAEQQMIQENRLIEQGVSSAITANQDKFIELKQLAEEHYQNAKEMAYTQEEEDLQRYEQAKQELLAVESQYIEESNALKKKLTDAIGDVHEAELIAVRESVAGQLITREEADKLVLESNRKNAEFRLRIEKDFYESAKQVYDETTDAYKQAHAAKESAVESLRQVQMAALSEYEKAMNRVRSTEEKWANTLKSIESELHSLRRTQMTDYEKWMADKQAIETKTVELQQIAHLQDEESQKRKQELIKEIIGLYKATSGEISEIDDGEKRIIQTKEEGYKGAEHGLNLLKMLVGDVAEMEVKATKETAETWKEKYEELGKLIDSTFEKRDFEVEFLPSLEELQTSFDEFAKPISKDINVNLSEETKTTFLQLEELGKQKNYEIKIGIVPSLSELLQKFEILLKDATKIINIILNPSFYELKNMFAELTRDETKTIRIKTIRTDSDSSGYNQGGFIPGVGNTDTVPAMLTPGEFVVRKSVVQKLGQGFFGALNNFQIPSFSNPMKFADGGLVPKQQSQNVGTVNFVIGQKSFQMEGDISVAETLIKELKQVGAIT